MVSSMASFKIGSRGMGKGYPCFIIAEAGVNHNGKFRLAKKLVEEAAKAGADAIKFQTYKTEDLITTYAPKAAYQDRNIGKKKTQFQMLKELEQPVKDIINLKNYAKDKGIILFSTPYDTHSVDLLEKIDMPAYKLASIEVVSHPFIEYVAETKKPVILSTAMSTMKEIEDAVKVLRKTGNKKLALLQCYFNYPTDYKDANIKAMDKLKKFGTVIGFSDHTMGYAASVAAVALGAKVIEKHFTLSRKMKGPDHKASLEPKELAEMVRAIRQAELSLGDGVKRPRGEEVKNRKVSRKSIVAKHDIPQGKIITKEMLAYKRPGSGLFPTYENIGKIVGKKAGKELKKDEQITLKKVRK